jgi:hypothetical protein
MLYSFRLKLELVEKMPNISGVTKAKDDGGPERFAVPQELIFNHEDLS